MNRASALDRLHIHGAGRNGRDAWPHHEASSDRFIAFPPESSIAEQVELLVGAGADRRVILFAHSIGAVPAALAVATGSLDVIGLVLVEPALYDIARGRATIERHISIVEDARARAANGDLRGFWAILRPLMFGGAFDAERWDQERPIAQHWAVTNVPWGHGVRASMVAGVPMLVVTGGWNEEYEEIASVLTAEGAQHQILRGAAHRPQDLSEFPTVVAEFEKCLLHGVPDGADAAARS